MDDNRTTNSVEWDFFIAHSGPDTKTAESLYDALAPHSRVFLDSRCLRLGDDWDNTLAVAQRRSLVTVVLVSSNSDNAYYQREEVAAAVAMARKNPRSHRVVPLYSATGPDDVNVPYGLQLKHGISLASERELPDAANRLLSLLTSLSARAEPGRTNSPREQDAGTAGVTPRNHGGRAWTTALRKPPGRIAVMVIGSLGILLALASWKAELFQQSHIEAADVRVSTNLTTLSVGQSLEVQVTVVQRSALQVSKGVVRLHVDPQVLIFFPDSPQNFNTEEVAGVMTLAKPFVLAAAGAGAAKTEIHATLETRFGTYKSPSATIEVSPADSQNRPFIERGGTRALNLSGEWHIEIGGVLGQMAIQQDARNNVTGTYSLDGASESAMTVEGFKDGTSFKVFFERQPALARRWRVDANFELNPKDARFIEMKGCAFLIQRDMAISEDSVQPSAGDHSSCRQPRNYVGWKGITASPFWASAQLRQ